MGNLKDRHENQNGIPIQRERAMMELIPSHFERKDFTLDPPILRRLDEYVQPHQKDPLILINFDLLGRPNMLSICIHPHEAVAKTTRSNLG